MKPRLFPSFVLFITMSFPLAAQASLGTRLASGEVEAAWGERIKASVSAQVSFELGVLESVKASERLWQAFDALGAGKTIPVLAVTGKYFPAARRKIPEPSTYAKVIAALADFGASLKKSAAFFRTGGTGTWKSAITPGTTRMDFNADGKRTEGETVAAFMQWATRREPGQSEKAYDIETHFDASDSLILAGGCMIISAIIDVALAYDLEPAYRAYGRIVFPFPADIPMPEKTGKEPERVEPIRLKPIRPNAGIQARAALLSGVAILGEGFSSVEAEMDDDAEWIGNANQPSANLERITEKNMTSYHQTLGESKLALEGKKLVPIEGSQKGFDLFGFLSALPILGDGIALPALAKTPTTSKPITGRGALPNLPRDWFESTF